MMERFYLIVDHTDWLARFLPMGLKLVQLRVKSDDQAFVIDQIKHAKALCLQHGATLIINDYWQHAIDLGCNYVHLGQEDLITADVNALKQKGIRLGISTHSVEELDIALSYQPDYVALGPIYETILKKMKFGPQGIDKLATWKAKCPNLPLVAIGGMTPERAALALSAGADSVAVVTDILNNESPDARFAQWMNV